MTTTFAGRTLNINGQSTELPWPILIATESEDVVYVLLDPDSYLADIEYSAARRSGAPAIRNLLAFSKASQKLWEAELPEKSDYYYKIISVEPLKANAFSSHRCELDPRTGAIVCKEFFK
jgi:hypothetical protein